MHNHSSLRIHRALVLAVFSLSAAVTQAQAPATPLTGAAVPVPAAGAAVAAAAAPAVDASASYSVGLTLGSQMHSAGAAPALSLDALARGLKDGLEGKAPTDEDRQRSTQFLQSARAAVAERNRAAAAAFLAQNGTVSGVVTTASGLQYMVVEPGDAKAASPKLSDKVTVQYRGRLLDGTEFDSSERHALAATFGLAGVIKGWREALPLMKPGAQWRLFIPPELAYGANSPPSIPPGSLLIFDIELVKIEPAPVMGPKAPKGQPGVKPAAAKPAAP